MLTITLSIGGAAVDGTLGPDALLSVADNALARAKELGGNRLVLHDSDHAKELELDATARWVTRIKDALRDERMVLFFQPVVDLASNQPLHYEGLIRMRDDQGELVPPGVFIPIAERFGLMHSIDRWVVDAALKALQEHPELTLFVNLSGPSLIDEHLVAFIETAVTKSGIQPGRLGFEVTETAALTHLGEARARIESLTRLGCRFALDDFGMGFSSFAYLRNLPADYVKLDGSFTRDLDADATNKALVQAITMVAHTLGKRVIAERVERAVDAELLRQLQVDYAQGYLWAPPRPTPPRPPYPAER